MPIVIGVGTVILSFLTWRLWREFGWDMYKRIGASLELQSEPHGWGLRC